MATPLSTPVVVTPAHAAILRRQGLEGLVERGAVIIDDFDPVEVEAWLESRATTSTGS